MERKVSRIKIGILVEKEIQARNPKRCIRKHVRSTIRKPKNPLDRIRIGQSIAGNVMQKGKAENSEREAQF